MDKIRFSVLIVIMLLVVSCTTSTPSATPQPATPPPLTTTPTNAGKPTPEQHNTPTPDVREAVSQFLTNWKAENYDAMYAQLAQTSQDATPKEAFIKRYKDAATSLTLTNIDFEILSTLVNIETAQAAYRVTYHTSLVGDLTRDISINLARTGQDWRVQWEEGMVLPELRGGNQLVIDYSTPARGNIYDRAKGAIAATNDAISLGIVPFDFEKGGESNTLATLARLTGKPSEWIKALYKDKYVQKYIPVGETTADQFNPDTIGGLAGLQWKAYKARYYNDGGIAPHVTGYMLFISPEEQESYKRQGYLGSEKVGKRGLEKWGEKYLMGTKGVSLYVVDPQGNTLTRLAQTDPQPAKSIYTTIDSKLQLEAQKAISGFNGAVVVMERNTGRVLAMASSPGFNPNQFEPQNINNVGLAKSLGDNNQPLVNRAAESGYPLGSVFKIISMATALETGIFKAEDTYLCEYYYTELPGYKLKDWTLDHEVAQSGLLTLPEGLMRSCNPWFYHIGFTLFEQGKAAELAKMARAFGLGVPTGIEQIAEYAGGIPEPESVDQSVFMAIGQDKIQVTPLQVAAMIAAVGNGGTLYRPQIVEKITDPDGKAVFTFQPIARNQLPVKPENLKLIQETLKRVVSDPRGTAVRVFSGLSIPIYGKTGTAETGVSGQPNAWFAAYTDAQRADKPDIAVAVLAEYAGEGSEIAAPITRRMMEVYFLGQVQKIFPWEAKFNVTRTPTPNGSETPVPSSGGTGPGSSATEAPSFSVQTATPSK
jgi:penicillin-binding protein 2